jgi:hypothetical protein
MSATPSRRTQRAEPHPHPPPVSKRPATSRRNRTPVAERRRRERHFRRRRRDLLEDTSMALLLSIIFVTVTAGLGVLALLELPVVVALVGSGQAGRLLGARRARARQRAARVRR